MRNKAIIVPFVEVFSKVISFCNVLLMVRILSIQEYADYSYIVAIVIWASVLMDGGINSLIYNKGIQNKINGINILFTSRSILSGFIIIILFLFFIVKKSDLVISGVIFSFAIYFSSSSALIKMLSRGLGFVKVDVISIISEPLMRFIFLIALFLTSQYYYYNLDIVLSFYLLSSALAFVVNQFYLKDFFRLKINFSGIKRSFRNIFISLKLSKYFLLYYALLIGISRLDIIFMEMHVSKRELSIFSSGLNIYLVAQLFFFSIITSQFTKLNKRKKRLLIFILPLLTFVIVITNLISPYIYRYLFPVTYEDGQLVLNFLIFALLPSVINFYFITKNNYENKVKINFLALLPTFIIKWVFYSILKPKELDTYTYVFLSVEVILLLIFALISIYESITNK